MYKIVNVIVLIIIILFCSCKTTKYNTREVIKTNIEAKTDTREGVQVLEEIKVSDNITQLMDELTTIIERIIAVKLSMPDSTGVQYPTEVITTEREYSKEKTVRHEASPQLHKSINIQHEKTDNSQMVINEDIEKTDKTIVKKTTPVWVIVAGVVLFIVIIIIVYLLLKKYRIIKSHR